MRRLPSLLCLALLLLLSACSSPGGNDDGDAPYAAAEGEDALVEADTLIGEAPAATAAFLPVAEMVRRADELDGETVEVEGVVGQVCRVKGCWLTLRDESADPVRVVVPKDERGEYVFTFPTSALGQRAQLTGTLSVTEESVEMRRHLAEDEGRSPEEVAAITEPRRALVLTASGIRLLSSGAEPDEATACSAPSPRHPLTRLI